MKKLFFMIVAIAAFSTSSFAYIVGAVETWDGGVSSTVTYSAWRAVNPIGIGTIGLHVDFQVYKTGATATGGAYFYSGNICVKSVYFNSNGGNYQTYRPDLDNLSFDKFMVWANAGDKTDNPTYANSGLLSN